MEPIVVDYKHIGESKNFEKFSPAQRNGPTVGTLYVDKEAFEDGVPEIIEMTIKAKEEA